MRGGSLNNTTHLIVKYDLFLQAQQNESRKNTKKNPRGQHTAAAGADASKDALGRGESSPKLNIMGTIHY